MMDGFETSFRERIAQVLEMDSVDASTRFRDAPGWCSLMAFGILVALDNDFAAPMDADEFAKRETVGDLEEWIRAK